MSLDSLYPYAGDHAIQNAVFAVDFQAPLGAEQLSDVQKDAAKALSKDFPSLDELQVLSMNFGPGQALHASKATPQPGGFQMKRLPTYPGVEVRNLTVNADQCLIMIPDYTRWDAVRADVDRYLNTILKTIERLVIPVRAIGLQYTDVFHWKADRSELIMSEVFRSDSPYVVPNILGSSSPSLWHSHHGYFTEHAGDFPFRQLDNINVSLVDVNGSPSVHILTSHRAQFTSPIYQVGDKNRALVSTTFDRLHQSNKDILGKLLSSQVLAKIKF